MTRPFPDRRRTDHSTTAVGPAAHPAPAWQSRGMADTEDTRDTEDTSDAKGMALADRTLVGLDEHLEGVGRAVGVIRGAVTASWMGAAVPTCPGWTLLDVVAHLGMVHRWGTAALLGDREAMAGAERQAEEGRTTADPVRWLSEGASRVVATVESLPDDVEALVFLKDAPPPRRFWARRMCHESTVHALDAMAAREGRSLHAQDAWFEPVVAADGVDELLRGFWQRSRGGPRSAAPQTVAIRPQDLPVAWLLEIAPDRAVATRVGAGGATGAGSEVTGSAIDLYLALWNRGGDVIDEQGHLERWREQAPIGWSR